MRAIPLAAAALVLAAAAPAAPPPDNRAIVTDFARIFYAEKDPRRAFERYVAPEYVQHNPGIADGRDAAVAALAPMFAAGDRSFEVQRILVDGDLAAIHVRVRTPNAPNGAAVADFYRLKGGRIVEHWDVLQVVPSSSANPHPMF